MDSQSRIPFPALSLSAAAMLTLSAGVATAQWVEFVDETDTRVTAAAGLVIDDTQEKDYAVGDVDNDGDEDLVIARKQPFTSTGKDTNVLLLNEGGVLVDRTSEFASASDVAGDQGFLTPTNDRDIQLADLNGDGWLDIVTAPTLTDNQAKHLSHPRVYINLGEDGNGDWLGFEFQDARIPEMHPTAGPRFCSVATGDVDGDGDLDLYFGDYDSGGFQISDYNNKLLINDGNGFFADETNARLTSEMRLSAFGAASEIHDMNNDGVMDVVKQTSLNAPQHVAVTYNNPANEGVFNQYDIVDQNAPYFVTVGDLNNDNRLDMVIVDDGSDKYYLNQGNDSQGRADFVSRLFSFDQGGDPGFGGNAVIRDLNNDGFQDVIVTDVDVDIPGCSRRTNIFRNLGNVPNVTLNEQRDPDGSIASIPASRLLGVHDIALIDINGDDWVDMVVGRCSGTEIYINQPPTGVSFAYPSGLPAILTPGEGETFTVDIAPIGGATIQAGSEKIFFSLGGVSYQSTVLTPLGGTLYEATLPGIECADKLEFYLQARVNGALVNDPPAAPISSYSAIAQLDTVSEREEFDAPVLDWIVTSENVVNGEWERADPNGTISGGVFAAPNDDAGASSDFCFVTENGQPGDGAGAADLDGGPTILTSPTLDFSGTDGTISYSRWFFCNDQGVDGEDVLETQISNDNGATWVTVDSTAGTNQGPGTDTFWETVTFVVSDFVGPNDQIRVRFIATDTPNNSVTEAGIDNFTVNKIVCASDCPGDATGDGTVDINDINEVLSNFGDITDNGDVTGDGVVDINDLNEVLSNWGESC